jgi:oligosaccharide repeat unit polymerase
MIENQPRLRSASFSKQRIMIILITIILMSITYLVNVSGCGPQQIFMLLSVLGLIIFGWIILSWVALEKELISIYVFFMLFSVLFYLGQPIAFLLGADNSTLNVYSIKIYSYTILNETLVFVLISYMLIHLGAIIFRKKFTSTKKINGISNDFSSSMNFVGILLLSVSIIPTLILIINSINAVSTKGYIGLFTSTNTIAVNGGLLGVSAGFFVPSLYLLLIANANRKFERRSITTIFLLYILVVFMLGRRGENSVFLLGYLLIWHNLVKPIKGKKLLRVIMLGILMILLLSIISSVRSSIGTGGIVTVVRSSILNTNIVDIIRGIFSEFGITLLVPATIIDKVPKVIPFYNGKTILNFFMMLIPNIFWETNPGLIDGTLERLVSPFIRSGTVGGIGGSFLAELYYNFGYFSYLCLPFYGVLLAWMTKLLDCRRFYTNKLMFYFSVYMFTNVLWVIRSEILTSGKEILYFAIFPIVLIKFLNKTKLYRK